MLTKISYTADIEDVLLEVANLLECTGAQFENIQETLIVTTTNLRSTHYNSNEFFESVNQLRKNLSKIDLRVAEVFEILLGYDQYKKGLITPEPTLGGVDEPEENIDD